jgi:hypothetical protein
MTPPTAKGTATEIELGDPSPTGHVGAEKPEPSAAIGAWGRREADLVSLRVAVVAIGQLYPVLEGGDT